MKPSDFPRDAKFHDPSTSPFQDEAGMYHVLSHADVMRVLQNKDEAFSRDQEPYLAEGAPIHMAMDFMWMVEPFTLDGEAGRHDVLRSVVEPWFRNNAVQTMEPVIRRLTVDTVNEVVSKGTGEVNVATEFAAANRDEAVNGGRRQSDPSTFDPERWPNRHLALGWATHHCPGSELARLETKILLQEALRRLPGLRMDTSKPFRRIAGIVDSVTEAHFTFDQDEADRIRSLQAA